MPGGPQHLSPTSPSKEPIPSLIAAHIRVCSRGLDDWIDEIFSTRQLDISLPGDYQKGLVVADIVSESVTQ
jgi:hypothetical protein